MMTALTEKLELMMQSRGVSVLKDSTKKHIRRKLESELENYIHIFTAANGQLILVPDSVTLQDVVLENQSLKNELKVWKMKSTSMDKIIDQTYNPPHGLTTHLMSTSNALQYHITCSGFFWGYLLETLKTRILRRGRR